MGDHVGQWRVGPLLAWDRAHPHLRKPSFDSHRRALRHRRLQVVEAPRQGFEVERPVELDRAVGGEPHHDGERSHRLDGHGVERPVEPRLPRPPLDDEQLTVTAVEGAQAEVTVLEQFADRHVAIEVAGEQSVDRRRPKEGVVAPLGMQLGVPHQVHLQGGEELLLAHRRGPVAAQGRPYPAAPGSPDRVLSVKLTVPLNVLIRPF